MATYGFIIGIKLNSPQIIRIAGYLNASRQTEQPFIAQICDYKKYFVEDDREVIKELIRQGFSVNKPSPETGNPPITNVANIADVELVKLLLDNGADVNAQNSVKLNAALRICGDGGRETLEILTLLVEHGWDLSSQQNGIIACWKMAKTREKASIANNRKDDQIVKYLEQIMTKNKINFPH